MDTPVIEEQEILSAVACTDRARMAGVTPTV
jgi:hypothetical protein